MAIYSFCMFLFLQVQLGFINTMKLLGNRRNQCGRWLDDELLLDIGSGWATPSNAECSNTVQSRQE